MTYAAPASFPDAVSPAGAPSQPDLNDIALFVEVARRGNISRAADTTGVPASTVSRRLRKLEATLGVSLLVRTTRQITLTDAGRLYFERCRQLVEEVRDAHSVLHELGVRPRGTLRVLLPEPLEALDFTQLAREFAEHWPELEYRYDYSHEPNPHPARQFDVALRWGEQADSDLIARRLADIPHQLYASPHYLREHGVPASPGDLIRHECLGSDVCGELSAWTLERDGERVRIPVTGRFGSNNPELLRRLAITGAGIVALPCVGSRQPDHMVPVLPAWQLASIPLYAMFASRRPPARTRVFLDFLQARIQEMLHRKRDAVAA